MGGGGGHGREGGVGAGGAAARTLTSASMASWVSAEQSAGCAIWEPTNDWPPPLVQATWQMGSGEEEGGRGGGGGARGPPDG